MLAGSRLSFGANRVRLEVSQSARVPDSEAVSERLSLLAATLGVKSFEITVTDGL